MHLISLQDLGQSLILKFIQDDYKEILYWGDKQIDYYYLPYIQPSQKARRKNMEEFGESKISKLSNHVEDNVIKEVVDKQF
jgi:hypothetical protein